MKCRIGINVECCTVLHAKGSLLGKILIFYVMSDAFLIIVGSTQVGLIPALVRHQEIEMWAEGKEVKQTRGLDELGDCRKEGCQESQDCGCTLG